MFIMFNLRKLFGLTSGRLVLPAERVGETLDDLIDVLFQKGATTDETVATFEGERELGKPFSRAKIGDLPNNSTFQGSTTIQTKKIGPLEKYQIVPVFKLPEQK